MEKTIIAVKFCDYKRRITDNRLRYYRTSKKHGLNHLIEVPYFEKRRFAVVWSIDIPHWRVPFGAYIGDLDDLNVAPAAPAAEKNMPSAERESAPPKRARTKRDSEPMTLPLRPWAEEIQ